MPFQNTAPRSVQRNILQPVVPSIPWCHFSHFCLCPLWGRWHSWSPCSLRGCLCGLQMVHLLNTAQPGWCSLAAGFPFSGKEFSCQCRRCVFDRSPSQEDPLEEGMATHSNILTWEIPWTEKPGGLQSVGSQCVGHD